MATITVPTAGDPVQASWGADVAEAINNIYDYSRAPYALPQGMHQLSNAAQTISLAAVSAGVGGVILVGMNVVAPMDYTRIAVWNASTSSAREAECRLYRDVGTDELQYVTGTAGTTSFTPSSAGMRYTSAVTAVRLNPGIYWLALRNTSSSQTFQIGLGSNTTDFGQNNDWFFWGNGPALGDTFDITDVNGRTELPFIRLEGEIFGGTVL